MLRKQAPHTPIYSDYRSPSHAMPRITVELTPEEHRALKLLAILESKKLGTVLKEAIHQHLRNKGAHDLKVMAHEESEEE